MSINIRDLLYTGNYGDIVTALASSLIDPTELNNLPLKHACRNGYIHVARELLSDGRVTPTEELLYIAVENNHPRIVDLLIKNDLKPSKEAILLAIKLDCLEIVQLLLLDNKVDPDPGTDNGETFLYICKQRQTKMIRLLLNDGRTDPSRRNNQALRNAAKAGDLEIISLLMDDYRVDSSGIVEKDNDQVARLLSRKLNSSSVR